MDRNKIRHLVLKQLVKNYQYVLEKHGENNWIPQMFEDELQVRISDVLSAHKITYSEFYQASSQAIRDKAYEFIENKDHDECIQISDNTFILYHEQTYLKPSQWYNKSFLKTIWPVVFAGLISWVVSVIIQKSDANKYREEQERIDKQQDSLINELRSSHDTINKH